MEMLTSRGCQGIVDQNARSHEWLDPRGPVAHESFERLVTAMRRLVHPNDGMSVRCTTDMSSCNISSALFFVVR